MPVNKFTPLAINPTVALHALKSVKAKTVKNFSTRRMGFSSEAGFLPFEGWLFRRN
jgi:hypothetical protein